MIRENRHRTARRANPSRPTSSQHRTHRGPSSLRWRDSARSEGLDEAEATQIQKPEPPKLKKVCQTPHPFLLGTPQVARALRDGFPNTRIIEARQKYIFDADLPNYGRSADR